MTRAASTPSAFSKTSFQRILLFTLLVAFGLWLRTLPTRNVAPSWTAWLPWQTTVVTLYFAEDGFLFPVSRRMPRDDDLPRAVLQALLAGPPPGSGLTTVIPAGVELRSVKVVNGMADVDLSAGSPDGREIGQGARDAIVETLTAVPGVTSVSLSVEGTPVGRPASRRPLLYFASANGLVAVPAVASDPHAAIAEYVSDSPDPRVTRFPADVRLLSYDYDRNDGLISLNLSYTPSVHTLALERPDQMRMLLLGLVAGLTEFPDVRAVQIDFEGHSRLGLGQCSDLLQTPQRRPALLNDERLLVREAASR